jgi:hypothetical protein
LILLVNIECADNPGNDLTGVDNFKTTYAWWLKYWNISGRADYHINEKWRLFARFSKFETRLDNPNYTGTIAGRYTARIRF